MAVLSLRQKIEQLKEEGYIKHSDPSDPYTTERVNDLRYRDFYRKPLIKRLISELTATSYKEEREMFPRLRSGAERFNLITELNDKIKANREAKLKANREAKLKVNVIHTKDEVLEIINNTEHIHVNNLYEEHEFLKYATKKYNLHEEIKAQVKVNRLSTLTETRRGNSRNNILYIWEAKSLIYNNKKVYKIGITSDHTIATRIERVATKHNVEPVNIRVFNTGDRRADLIEAKLHQMGEIPDNIKRKDGYTEFRALDEKELNECIKIAKG